MTTMIKSSDEFVTIVTGLPRSGTSMMMQMLSAGGLPPWTDEVRSSDANNPRGYYEHERVKSLASDNSWLPDARGHAIKIIAPLLPNVSLASCRIIFMERNLAEILRSQSEMLKRDGKPGGRLSMQQLASVLQRYLKNVDEFGRNAGHPTLRVSYRRCVEAPSKIARQVNNFLGGELNEAPMAAVVDQKLYRERE